MGVVSLTNYIPECKCKTCTITMINNSLITMTMQNRIAGEMQIKFRLRKCCYKKLFFKFWRSDVIVIAMINGEIITKADRFHGCVFVIVIGGINIIKS